MIELIFNVLIFFKAILDSQIMLTLTSLDYSEPNRNIYNHQLSHNNL